MKKKLIVLLIAACMLLTCFACGGGNSGGNGPKPPPSFNEKWAALPDKDFETEEFRISTRGEYEQQEVLVADENSENLLDIALMVRNAAVEDRYNVVITPVSNGGGMGRKASLDLRVLSGKLARLLLEALLDPLKFLGFKNLTEDRLSFIGFGEEEL